MFPSQSVMHGADDAVRDSGEGASRAAAGALPDCRVLVIDDQEPNRLLLCRQLKRLGLTAEAVSDGSAALAAVSEQSYGLVITDCHMPVMDGLELTRRLREAEAEAGRVRMPILGLTGDLRSETQSNCLAAGMDAVEFKPVRLPGLRETLLRLLLGQNTTAPFADDNVRALPTFHSSNYCELYEVGEREGEQWLQSYLGSVARLLAEMERGIEMSDREGVTVAAHALAGNSLIAGALATGMICRKLEEAARHADWSFIRGLVRELLDTADQTNREIHRFLSQTGEPASC